MNDTQKENRERLRDLTDQAQEKAKEAGLNLAEYKKNVLLMRFIYNPEGNKEFKSFRGWLMEGRTVQKGAKAFLLWGQPKDYKKKDGKEDQFFPLAYVFEKSQTKGATEIQEEREKRQATRDTEPEQEPDNQPEEPGMQEETQAAATALDLNF